MKKAVFIAATGQNVGKTTVCLGLLSGLTKRLPAVGFLKPVGQQHRLSSEGTEVDKDVILFKDHFHLSSSYAAMSPVICPHGFTRDFLDHKVTEEKLLEKIAKSYQTLAAHNDFVLVEGTGHIGVGSIFHLNNAKIAKHLGLDVVMIATGGLGSTFDELALNINMCQAYGVSVRGVILNKVHESKREMILEYFPKSLSLYGIPLIGCIPFQPLLSIPMMKDYESLFGTSLLSGHEHRLRHYTDIKLIAGSLNSYRKEMGPQQLLITPACRVDIVDEILQESNSHLECGVILTGADAPSEATLTKIQASQVPVLFTPLSCYDVMKTITTFTAKIRNEDTVKVDSAIHLVEEHVNFDVLMRSFSESTSLEMAETDVQIPDL